MDVMRMIDRSYFTEPVTYWPDYLIENLSSVIWTERYLEPGECQLKTTKIKETLAVLPERSLITLRDSREVMLTETYSIESNADGVPELTIEGRTIDAFLEYRLLYGPWQKVRPLQQLYTTAEAAALILWNQLVNGTLEDVTMPTGNGMGWGGNLPHLDISLSITDILDVAQRWVQVGPLYPQLYTFLQADNLGIRSIRPPSEAQVVSVATVDPNRGVITLGASGTTTALLFDIYNGLDRSVDQSVNTPVIFHHADGHLAKFGSLTSLRNYYTSAWVVSEVGVADVVRPGMSFVFGGWDQRTLFLDAGSPDPAQSQDEFRANLPIAGQQELNKYNRDSLISAEVAASIPYKYKEHYGLGDKITLLGAFGVQQTMRVTEYIRTFDAAGERAFPTLVQVG